MLLWATTVIHISEQICYISKWKYYSFSYNNVYYGNKLSQNDQHDCDYIIFRYMQAHCYNLLYTIANFYPALFQSCAHCILTCMYHVHTHILYNYSVYTLHRHNIIIITWLVGGPKYIAIMFCEQINTTQLS